MTTQAVAPQPGILAALPVVGRHLTFRLARETNAAQLLQLLARIHIDESVVLGLGAPLTAALGLEVPGLRAFPALNYGATAIPSTQLALWIWLRGSDPGELLHRCRKLEKDLAGVLVPVDIVDTFQHREGRDLTGYLDGTENPQGQKASDAAFISGKGAIGGGSFVAIQQWQHDLDDFTARSGAERDQIMGRRISDNQEIVDAPDFAHVKRAAQESFDPPAFMLRRSMPWLNGDDAGLMFVAFGHSLDAFEAVLRRMVGLDDGIVDGLFKFSRPISGGYYFCPPCAGGKLQLDGS
ncbi:MAG TPA: Dyp-type peroxidase [Polyangiaceae bacterium]|nr:Dyp-type peroxidase [Polyangiaceae bacterium]